MIIYIVAGGLVLLLVLYVIFNSSLKRNITKDAFVETPDNDTIQELNQNFVWIKFNHSGKNLSLKYYYDTAVFEDSYDFYTTNKMVKIKFEDKNPENFIVIQDGKGGYTNLLASGLIGGTIGIVAASSQINWNEKIKTFLIVGGICFALAYLLLRLSPLFDFLNYFKKKEE